MADQTEINRAVHEAMGKCWHPWLRNGHCEKCGIGDSFNAAPENPDYCSDLNAVAEFEAFVIDSQENGKYRYWCELVRAVRADGVPEDLAFMQTMCATALQRARAGLAVCRKLEEDNYE